MAAEVIGVAVKVDRQAGGELALRDYDAVAGAIRQQFDRIAVHRGCESSLERRVADVADLSDRTSNDPVIAVLDRSLVRRNVLGLGLQRVFTAGDEASLVLGVHDLRAALGGLESTARDAHRDLREVVRAVALRIAFIDRGVAHDRAAGDVQFDRQQRIMLADRDAGASSGRAAAVGIHFSGRTVADDGTAGNVQLAGTDLDADALAVIVLGLDVRPLIDVDLRVTAERNSDVVRAVDRAAHVHGRVALKDVAEDEDQTVHGSVDVYLRAVALFSAVLVHIDIVVHRHAGIEFEEVVLADTLRFIRSDVRVNELVERALRLRTVLNGKETAVEIDIAAAQGLPVQIDGKGLAVVDDKVLGVIAQHDDGLAILDSRDGVSEGSIVDVADLRDRYRKLARAVTKIQPGVAGRSRDINIVILLNADLVRSGRHSRSGGSIQHKVAVDGFAL